MKKFLFIFLTATMLFSCSNSKAEEESQVSKDTLSAAEIAAKAEADSIAYVKAREDSLRNEALKNDTLKERHIVIDKPSFMLYLREDGKTLMEAKVCIGKGIGQKKRQGDHKTPEGTYKIRAIQQASGWTYDFHDGKGKRKGAYGPWFLRLDTPQSTHIGIHGSPFPETVGTRDSDGCIRMVNEDLEKLKEQVKVGTKVVINPDK